MMSLNVSFSCYAVDGTNLHNAPKTWYFVLKGYDSFHGNSTPRLRYTFRAPDEVHYTYISSLAEIGTLCYLPHVSLRDV